LDVEAKHIGRIRAFAMDAKYASNCLDKAWNFSGNQAVLNERA
jgi:hypothetical protein